MYLLQCHSCTDARRLHNGPRTSGSFHAVGMFRRRRAIAIVSAATDRVDLCLSRLQAPSTRTECPLVQAFQSGLDVRGRVCGGILKIGARHHTGSTFEPLANHTVHRVSYQYEPVFCAVVFYAQTDSPFALVAS